MWKNSTYFVSELLELDILIFKFSANNSLFKNMNLKGNDSKANYDWKLINFCRWDYVEVEKADYLSAVGLDKLEITHN